MRGNPLPCIGGMHSMHIHDLDLNLLPVLDALLAQGSVSRAADALGLSQSAMSHALHRLRVYFNDPLFVRTATRMVPTPKAQELAPVVVAMMRNVRAHLVPGAGFDPAVASRNFTLSMTDMAELVFMPSFVPHFRREAPHCTLHIVRVPPRDLPAALEPRDVDLALGSTRLTAEGLYQQQVMRHPLVCIAGEDNPRFAAGMSMEAYLAAEHIAIGPFGGSEDIFEWALQERGVRRRFFMVTQSFLALPLLVAGTDLVATVPARLGEVFAAHAGIRVLPPPLELPALALRQTWHPRFHHDPACVWLRTLMLKVSAS